MDKHSASLIEERSRDPVLLTYNRFVRVLRKIVVRMDEQVRDMNLGRHQFDLLVQVAFDDGINQQTCAARMGVTKGNVTQHINRLEKMGVIRREKVGRTNHLHLTPAGEELVTEFMPVHDRRVREILSVLTAQEFQQFQSILRKFDRHRG